MSEDQKQRYSDGRIDNSRTQEDFPFIGLSDERDEWKSLKYCTGIIAQGVEKLSTQILISLNNAPASMRNTHIDT